MIVSKSPVSRDLSFPFCRAVEGKSAYPMQLLGLSELTDVAHSVWYAVSAQ